MSTPICSPRSLFRGTTILLALMVAVPAMADKAGSIYKKGREAELRQDYEAAYSLYQQAYHMEPKETKYRSAATRLRFLSSASHVHRGQVLRSGGKLEEALGEFQKAMEIDPASFIAEQEVRRTKVLIEAAQARSDKRRSAEENKRDFDEVPGPVVLSPVSPLPITMRISEDAKVVFETVGKLAGINVLFDPDYNSRRVNIQLNGVSLEEALRLIALQTNTFWRPVTHNTIFIANDTAAKRKQLEQSVIRTFYLANLSQPTELQDVVNTLRQVLELTRLTQIPNLGAIVVRGTPDQILLASKIIDDLDKAKPEVVVEVAIMQVSRDKVRKLGFSPPTSAGVTLQDNSSSSSSDSSSSSSSSSSSGISLNSLANLNANDFQVTIGQATANVLFTDSDSKLIQNPQVRALDGQKASLKIGSRVPVATGSYSAGVGTAAVSSLVNTQFQYIDVGVNVDITPRIHANGDVTLKLSLEISAVDSTTDIGGISEPVIGQRKIEHEIRLKEGEVNLLGGILEDQDIKSLSGYPGLMKIPILKYLFGSENTEKRQNEIVFALVPHIVRGHELTKSNLRSLDVGTGNTIEVRHSFSQTDQEKPSQ